jgi:protein-S-isoprenylcysteine O-methyltransferase Ste14
LKLPLPFVWPYALIFWAACVWAMLPEYPIIQKARKAAALPDSKDAGSLRVISIGGPISWVIAFGLAFTPVLRMPAAFQPIALIIGTAMVIAASLLRRHCFRQLGTSFTGDVRAAPDQRIVTTGAYSILRHPSYTAGILMNVGMGVALGNWGSIVVTLVAGFAVYAYRISVEERALTAAIGEPYREFARTRRRLIPYIY